MDEQPEAPAPEQGPADATAAYRVFDDLTDVVVVLDEGFGIIYANAFALDLLGYRPSDVDGRSITEFLNADDVGRAFEVATLMADDRVGVPVTPAIYDIQTADGRWVPIELNAVHPPPDTTAAAAAAGTMVVIGRYSGDHDLQNRILEMITSGADDADLIALIPEFGVWRHPLEQYAVLCRDVGGADRISGTDVVSRLIRDHPTGAPWSRAREEGGTVLVEVDALPAALRADATAAGLGTCWALAVPDPLHGDPAVLVGWSRVDGPPASVHRYALEIGARMLTLILQWRRQRVALERAARRDSLTEVANRAGFFDALDEALQHASEHARVGLLYVDLDGFKDVNDGHGHTVGDDVLRVVAARLAAAVRRDDLIGRLGGDEFAVLCPGVRDVDTLTVVARRIVDDISEPITIRGVALHVGASIGIATSAGRALPDELVDAADRALYRAKAAGRGRWQFADDPADATGTG